MPPKKGKGSKTPSSKSKPSDFKRLKAKVGKRAPQRLNATSTEVKSSRLKLTHQGQLSSSSTTLATGSTTGSSTGSSSSKPSSSLVYSPSSSVLTLPAPSSSVHQPFPLFLRLLTTHTSSSTRLQMSSTLLSSFKETNYLQSCLSTPGFTTLITTALSLMLLDSTQNSKGQTISPPIASSILTALLPHITDSLTISTILKYLTLSLLDMDETVVDCGVEVLRVMELKGLGRGFKEAVFRVVKLGKGEDLLRKCWEEEEGRGGGVKGFYERTYGKILEVDLKEEEEYNKVILGRVVEGCSNEKGYKKYSKEKDQRVRDLLECLGERGKKKGWEIVKGLEWRLVKNWGIKNGYTKPQFKKIGEAERDVFNKLKGCIDDYNRFEGVEREEGFWNATSSVSGIEELWLASEYPPPLPSMLSKLLPRLLRNELTSEINSYISSKVQQPYTDLHLELIMKNPSTPSSTYTSLGNYAHKSSVRLGIKEIYTRYKPSASVNLLSLSMDFDRSNKTEGTVRLLKLLNSERLNGVGGKVGGWCKGKEERMMVAAGIVKEVGRVEGWEGLEKLGGAIWEEIKNRVEARP
ncbi:hypothetical protein TrST_g10186 [Triparma strigata]|uniref:Uncharacterized protein n=1 Tax=Triparma strigata TaxID=1606541 RepID=A0A9W7E5M1_9STRA|nr:hypothetical protein TrST_g10186 [Triparma strigata]